MYKYLLLIIIALSGITQRAYCQKYTITGTVIDRQDKKPVGYATILLADNLLWTVSDEYGKFILKGVPEGKATFTIHSLGYATLTIETDVKDHLPDLVIRLQEDNLALEEVVVTATQKPKELTTSYLIDRTTLDHAQILNVADISSLLPGGQIAIKTGFNNRPALYPAGRNLRKRECIIWYSD